MTRADLHRLVDELPDESVDAAVVLLTRAKDPMLAALQAAPFDDEPETEEERRAVAAVAELGASGPMQRPEPSTRTAAETQHPCGFPANSTYGRSWIRTRDLFLIREAL
jgi:hypothetical protein